MKIKLLLITLIVIIFSTNIISLNGASVNNYITIYVDDDANPPYDGTQQHPYKHIQEGIDASVDGDMVFVYSGTYYESLVLNKSILLLILFVLMESI